MKQLFRELRAALTRGENAVLCIILAASGSSPRGAGAKMAVFADGHTAGTIGGGAVEHLAAAQALELLREGRSLCRAFSLTPNQVCDIGMICGGEVTVYYQPLTPEALTAVDALLDALSRAENAWLVMRMPEGEPSRMGLFDAEHGLRFLTGLPEEELRPMLCARAVYRPGQTALYAEPVSRAGRVYIFGGGHVGKALVPVLARVGFHVTVFDNRPELAKPEVYPEAEQVILGDYLHVGAQAAIGPEDYVVIMTPGHQADREVLLQAMRTEATYIGCIGSRKKIAATNAFLMENGIEEAALRRIHAPIGLPIEAQTPDEIAISVAAELILHRARHAKGEL